MKESESEVLKIEELESELLCTDSTALGGTRALHPRLVKHGYHPGGQHKFLPYFFHFVIHSHVSLHLERQ
jgi:hypothetical protein